MLVVLRHQSNPPLVPLVDPVLRLPVTLRLTTVEQRGKMGPEQNFRSAKLGALDIPGDGNNFHPLVAEGADLV